MPMKYGTMAYLFVDRKVLMIKKFDRKNDPNSGFYTLPGGNLNEHEMGTNPQGRLESTIRETKEETGVILINPILKGVILFDNQGRIFPNWPNPDNFLVHLFSANQYSGKLSYRTKEGVPLWVIEHEILTLPSNPGDRKMYEWLRDSRFFIGVIRHKGDVLDEEGTFVDYYNYI